MKYGGSILSLLLVLTALQGGFVSAQNSGEIYMWNFNEGEGLTVADDSGQFTAQLGDPVRLPVVQNDSPSGQADDRSVIPYGGFEVDDSENPVLNLQQGPVTIEAWIKPVNLTGAQDIVRIGNSLKAGFTGTNLVFTLLGVVDVIPDVLIPVDNAWHHVAYAWEPGVGVTFYLDGAEVAYMEETRAAREFQNNLLSIGSSHDAGSVLQAGLDRLRIHHAVLEAGDLDSNAASVKALSDSVVVAYNFDEADSPYQNSTAVERPASSMAEAALATSIPVFSTESPTGDEGDYSIFFAGDDTISYDDNGDYLLEIV